MIALEFQFTAGQYHATPWGRHVNEGDVEWPPSPWRVLRCLIAVWFRTVGEEHEPQELLISLVEHMSGCLPVYQLPPAVHTQTRHYMPLRYTDTTLVYDAFARISAKDKLVMAWPGLESLATDGEVALLKTLAANISYLGRAESWVAAQCVENWNGRPNCYPAQSEFELQSDTMRIQAVPLTAPVDVTHFAEWYQSIEHKKNRKDWLPSTLFEALTVDTLDLEKGRWNVPPGTRAVVYLRPEDSLNSYSPSPPVVSLDGGYNVARFALGGNLNLLPKWTDAVLIGDLLHLALMGRSDEDVPTVISGRDASGHVLRANHRHGFCLPEDTDGDGRVDHLIFVSHDPFANGVLQAIQRLDQARRLWTPDRWPGQSHEWPIRLEVLGRLSDSGSLSLSDGQLLPLLASSQVWQSITPYFHPWYAKKHGKFGAEEQLRRELRQRGMPDPVSVSVQQTVAMGDTTRSASTSFKCSYKLYEFRRRRPSHPGQSAPDKWGSFIRLEFPVPVAGPLALGFACHFGLGLFAPVL